MIMNIVKKDEERYIHDYYCSHLLSRVKQIHKDGDGPIEPKQNRTNRNRLNRDNN